MAKVLEASKTNRLYHIKNSNLHQTYNGIHKYDCLRQAIYETRGMVLTYQKKPIEAMFDCCCGGVIPAHITAINVQKTPYLARKVPCTFCQSCKIYRWRYMCTFAELKRILLQGGYTIGDIKEVKIGKCDKVGYVQQVLIRDGKKTLILTGRQMYSLINKIKSFVYSIERKGNAIVFVGKGYGHHLGICQWGARKMVDMGWTYKKILSFYYPYTHIMELKNTVKRDAKL
jgi:stage II sporulation protein D